MLHISDDSVPPPPQSGLRYVLPADLVWMLDLAQRRYPPFNSVEAVRWALGRLDTPDSLVIRTDAAFLIAGIGAAPWRPDRRECHVLFICAEPGAVWEIISLLRYSVRWGKRHGAVVWRLGADVPIDLWPLARRVGAERDAPRFIKDLA